MSSNLVQQFRGVDGELRLLATFDSTSWEILFIDDTLQDRYSMDDLKRAHQDIVANQISSDDLRDVGAFGTVSAQVYYFDEVIHFQIPTDRYEGVFASYNRDDPFPVDAVIQIAEQISQLS